MATDVMERINPLIAEAQALNEEVRLAGNWAHDAQRARYHELVRAIYEPLRPLLQSLVDAGIVSATLYEDEHERFVWFEVDQVEVNGTIDFAGRRPLEATDPPPKFL